MKNTINIFSHWYNIYICSACEVRMSFNKMMNSVGVCRNCGHFISGTVCETKTVTARKIKHYKWWWIRNRKSTFVGKNEFSQNWLDSN